jgi:hypothetical protein
VKYVTVLVALCAVLAVGAAPNAQGAASGGVEGRVLVNPLSVVLRGPPDPVRAGRDFRLRAEVTNAGSTTFSNVPVTLVAPAALTLREPATQTIPRIRQSDTRRAHWNACTTTVGNYVLVARVTVGPFTAESAAQVVQVVAANRPPSC